MTIKNTKASINIDGKTGYRFEFNNGVKQGDSLSAMLFNIALRYAIESIDQRGTIFTNSTQICAYADDIIVLSRTKNSLIQSTKELTEIANEISLVINEDKTKFMIVLKYEVRRYIQDL